MLEPLNQIRIIFEQIGHLNRILRRGVSFFFDKNKKRTVLEIINEVTGTFILSSW